MVLALALSFFISCLTSANRAMSIAKAMNVKVAARKDTSEAIKVTVTWVERPRRRATNETAAAKMGAYMRH